MNSPAFFCAVFALGAAISVTTGVACAQQYPVRPVRVVVPFPPGGISDGLARVIVQHLSTTQGQQFVVENRPGAGTTGDRVTLVTPSARSLPALMCGRAAGVVEKLIDASPPSTAATAGALPLYGICNILILAIVFSVSPDKCRIVPLPDDA